MSDNRKLAIMQPYLFPYAGYFSLINYTDHFIFFDTPQYIRKGWINRNRILKENSEVCYFTVPVKKAIRETSICDIEIDYTQNWKHKILGQLNVYKKKAPFYEAVMEVVYNVIERDYKHISELCTSSCIEVCKYLNMEFTYDVFSKMDLKSIIVNAPDEWALEITKALEYSIYVNPPGGMKFFDAVKYQEQGIDLQFLENNLSPYSQKNKINISGLSIIDVMMFNSIQDTKSIINDYKIFS